jgi:energy-coupling factor transporter transmembrane protein EcfT
MNRRFNTVLFLAGATVFNLLLLFFYFLAFTGIAGLFLPGREGWLALVTWLGLFVAALLSSWFTYRWAFGLLKEKVDLDRYFDSHLFKGLF